VLVTVLTVAGCSGGDGSVQRRPTEQQGYVSGTGRVQTIGAAQRDPAPELSGRTLDGATFTLSAHRGQVVVLNVWGSWCVPCRTEASGLQAVSRQLYRQGVRFVGIDTRDTTPAAQAFVRRFGVRYPSVVDADGQRLLAFRATLPVSAIPSTLVIDRRGNMAGRVIGAISQQSLHDLVAQVADER